MVIMISRDHAAFYQAIEARQELSGRDRVILDRRAGIVVLGRTGGRHVPFRVSRRGITEGCS